MCWRQAGRIQARFFTSTDAATTTTVTTTTTTGPDDDDSTTTTTTADDATDTVWVVTSGKLLQFSLDPQRWAQKACEIVGRNLTPDEWDRFVSGSGPVQSACP